MIDILLNQSLQIGEFPFKRALSYLFRLLMHHLSSAIERSGL